MSKYYTPTIEEFHVGFECEIKNNPVESIMDWWVETTIKERDSLEGYDVRVKYLDKEDIESLLFTLLSTELNIHTYKNEKILLIFNNSDHECRLYRIYKGNELRFKGTIRNKSELKTILKMVII